ncbi:hypothetical protein EZI54_06800 [Marinobacter halodurans]|uniref:Uncharacterized protein n=1 Tax=Marinobacter halodurans TaxID=2528979 RepID=A0ABY1ZM04_9GAMM|nr:hypothetical protein [Marinobacter halodurans]TBW57359.1 hypothetical protein EZI54_06800 [Marinobacter halodurans]
MEVVDSRKQVGDQNNIRLVDPLYYWSRHVEAAIEQGKGVLIFAPWFTQSEIITMVRVAMVAKYFAREIGDQGHEKIGDTVLKHLQPLANDEIMVNALGMAPGVDQWQPLEWLNAIRNLTAPERKRYNQMLGKNVRFLPDERMLEPWIAALAQSQYQSLESGPRGWLDVASRSRGT